MTREEILKADEKTLQKRWIELMTMPAVYGPDKSELNKEYLQIGIRINLIRGNNREAIAYSDELMRRYGESLK